MSRPIGYAGTPEERFRRKVNKNGPLYSQELGRCWLWTGCLDRKGYGQFRPIKKNGAMFAHRFSWELVNGPIIDGLYCLHKCDNPPCCNPEHLFLGTQQNNVDDMLKKGRGNKAHGENHYFAKFTDAQVIEIRAKYIPYRYTARKLAAEYSSTINNIKHIVSGSTRKLASREQEELE